MPTSKDTIRHDAGNLVMGAHSALLSFGKTSTAAEEVQLMRLLAQDGRRLADLAEQFCSNQELDHGCVDLVDTLDWAAHLLAHYPRRSGFTIEFIAPVSVVAIPEAILHSVVDNLIGNAVKYSPDRTDITIRAERLNERFAELRVIDEGCGVPPGQREAIFQRGYRLPRHAALPGTGFGLPISREALRARGGDLFHLPGESCGSQFVARLPIAHDVR